MLLSADDPRLAFDPDPEALARLLLAYVPVNDEQGATRVRMLRFLAEHPDALHRSSLSGHFTASALVIDREEQRGLLLLHKKLGRWLQPGGHCDGDANPAHVALRECLEETGLPELRVDPRVQDLDIHTIPARASEPEHLHLDVRFFVHAPTQCVPRGNDESLELRWVAPDELAAYEPDASVVRLFRLAFPTGPED